MELRTSAEFGSARSSTIKLNEPFPYCCLETSVASFSESVSSPRISKMMHNNENPTTRSKEKTMVATGRNAWQTGCSSVGLIGQIGVVF